MYTHSHTHTRTHKQNAREGRECKRKGKEKERQAGTGGFKHQKSAAQYKEAHGLRIAVTGSQRRLNQVNFFISENVVFFFFSFLEQSRNSGPNTSGPPFISCNSHTGPTSPLSLLEHRPASSQQREPMLFRRHGAMMRKATYSSEH